VYASRLLKSSSKIVHRDAETLRRGLQEGFCHLAMCMFNANIPARTTPAQMLFHAPSIRSSGGEDEFAG
jgi:hypothetical protein